MQRSVLTYHFKPYSWIGPRGRTRRTPQDPRSKKFTTSFFVPNGINIAYLIARAQGGSDLSNMYLCLRQTRLHVVSFAPLGK
jgi:hypothetical protein